VRLQAIRSFEAERWSGDIHRRVWPIVRDMHQELLRRFPAEYRSPPPPPAMRAHDDVLGLTALDVDGW
jgi:hypothetical protein